MAFLADVERLLERVFERSTARLFRARVQPVQVERRVERSMERARVNQGGRTLVPGRYRVRMNPADLDDVAAQVGGAEALAGRLADAALTFARSHAYHLPGRPGVALVADPSLVRGQLEVDAVLDASRRAGRAPGGSASPDPRPGAGIHAAEPVSMVAPVPGPPLTATPAPAWTPNPIVDAIEPDRPIRSAPAPALEEAYPGVRGDGTQTLVFRRPAPVAARAVLRVWAPGGGERTIEVDGTPLSIGRATDNGLALADTRVSRHHGRLQARRGTLVYTDLGSTNGSRVNGIRVDEIALGVGDRLLLGDTVLVVETLPG
ncbi:MAG: FhaA domain-containing protein [Candidatus Limnocylindrales bacterium]